MIKVEAKGIDDVKDNLERIKTSLSGNPILEAMGKAVLIVTNAAKKNVTVDRGLLRASITPDVQKRDTVVRGIVGSNKVHAAPQELGTRPFTPPWKPLFEWAKRKTGGNVKAAGALAFAARRAISKRGIRAQRYLQRAFETNIPKIIRIFDNAIKRIIK